MSTTKTTDAPVATGPDKGSGSVRVAPTVNAAPVQHAERQVADIDPTTLPVRPGEEPWTAEELDEVRTTLADDVVRFSEQLATSNADLHNLLRDGTEGAGRDPADVGSANFERDAEMSLANNAREMLDQSQLALRHIALGVYGSCDNCGQPIGKYRLQAFPRATLCVTCKQREERR
jgi:DnaK suppressor protein